MKATLYDGMQIYCLLTAGSALNAQAYWMAVFWLGMYLVWNFLYRHASTDKKET
jgi:hypothetical protein